MTVFSMNGYNVSVGKPDGRKRPAMFVKPPDDHAFYKVASFNSDETAEWFVEHMLRMTRAVDMRKRGGEDG